MSPEVGHPSEEALRAAVAAIPDPELPMLSIADLGILRSLRVRDSRVEVDITPTYSGCPAMEAIRAEIEAVLRHEGAAEVAVRMVLAPAWSTDWISEQGRHRLAVAGIAPPGPAMRPEPPAVRDHVALLPVREAVTCPRCGSRATEELSRFGSTACKSLHRCRSCAEPFERFKAH
jgi:ring-1,2-phenylacetyl-CoA epoxidase subunit PaaD